MTFTLRNSLYWLYGKYIYVNITYYTKELLKNIGDNKLEYSINELAELSGISTRTLRYYDEINLLSPSRVANNNYRVYRDKDVTLLQQILFYKELGLSLDEIKNILKVEEYDEIKTLNHHLV